MSLGKYRKIQNFFRSYRKKVTKTLQDSNESFVTISYKIKFIDSARFMTTKLSYLVDTLTERILKIKYKDFHCFLEYENVKDNLIKYKCLSCNKDNPNKISKIQTRFKNKSKFSNNDINKFILSFRKSVCPYEYINEKSLIKERHLKKRNFIAT